MTTTRLYITLSGSAVLIGFGMTKLLAQVFLAQWQVLSREHPDVAARGIWLLGLGLPEFAVVSAVLSMLVVGTFLRRTGPPLPKRLLLGALGGGAGASLILLGLDPTAPILRWVPWPAPFAYYAFSTAVAAMLLVLGILITWRLARAVRWEPAAA